MTWEALIEVMARAMCVAEFYNPDIIDFDGRENWKGYIRAISAALAALEAAGVRLVPSEVTEKMLDAPMSTGTASNVWQAANIYRAMLAASPYAQKEQTHESD